jgi:tetratricopeptide (TPR) repeat protein
MIAKEIASTYQLLGEREKALAWAKRIELSSLRNEVTSHYLSHLGRREEALKAARKAVELDPKNPKNRDRLGACHYEQDQYDDALREYQLCVELDPTVADYHQNLGVTLLEMGRFDQAESELKEAIRLDPQSPVFYENLSKVYARTGRLDLAVASVRKYLAIPGSRKTHETRFWLAQVLYDQGKLEEALGEQTKGLEQVPTNGREHYKRGFLLYRMDRLPEAVAEYEKAMLLSPEDFTPCTSLGELLFSMGGEDKGEELLLKAAELAPQSPVPCFTLARCFLQQRKHDDAIAHFEKAVERWRPGDKALEYGGREPPPGSGSRISEPASWRRGETPRPPSATKRLSLHSRSCRKGSGASYPAGTRAPSWMLTSSWRGTRQRLETSSSPVRPGRNSLKSSSGSWLHRSGGDALQPLRVDAPHLRDGGFEGSEGGLTPGATGCRADPRAGLRQPRHARARALPHGDVARAIATSEKALGLLPPPSPDDSTKRLLIPGAPDMSVAVLRKALEENLARFKAGLTAASSNPPHSGPEVKVSAPPREERRRRRYAAWVFASAMCAAEPPPRCAFRSAGAAAFIASRAKSWGARLRSMASR